MAQKDTPKEEVLIILNAYIDGELSPARAEKLERQIAENPQLHALLDQLHQTRQVVAALPRMRAPQDMAEDILRSMERDALLSLDSQKVAQAGRNHLFARRFTAAAAMILLCGAAAMVIYSILKSPAKRIPPPIANGKPVIALRLPTRPSADQSADKVATTGTDNAISPGNTVDTKAIISTKTMARTGNISRVGNIARTTNVTDITSTKGITNKTGITGTRGIAKVAGTKGVAKANKALASNIPASKDFIGNAPSGNTPPADATLANAQLNNTPAGRSSTHKSHLSAYSRLKIILTGKNIAFYSRQLQQLLADNNINHHIYTNVNSHKRQYAFICSLSRFKKLYPLLANIPAEHIDLVLPGQSGNRGIFIPEPTEKQVIRLAALANVSQRQLLAMKFARQQLGAIPGNNLSDRQLGDQMELYACQEPRLPDLKLLGKTGNCPNSLAVARLPDTYMQRLRRADHTTSVFSANKNADNNTENNVSAANINKGTRGGGHARKVSMVALVVVLQSEPDHPKTNSFSNGNSNSDDSVGNTTGNEGDASGKVPDSSVSGSNHNPPGNSTTGSSTAQGASNATGKNAAEKGVVSNKRTGVTGGLGKKYRQDKGDPNGLVGTAR